ncbi:MAG: DNA polymerase alpha zinc finger-domain-containing protein, partial [Olpidium bornovanus]
MSDAERFKNVERFTPSCRHCGQKGEVEGVTARAGASDPPASQVLTARPLASLEWQLVCAIRRHARRYIDGWLVCDDSACGARTRMMSVYGRRCLQVGCHGTMVY